MLGWGQGKNHKHKVDNRSRYQAFTQTSWRLRAEKAIKGLRVIGRQCGWVGNSECVCVEAARVRASMIAYVIQRARFEKASARKRKYGTRRQVIGYRWCDWVNVVAQYDSS
jgi:hypothetical protein